MLLYCLKYRKNTESKNAKFVSQKTKEWCFHQNVQCLAVKNQHLSKEGSRLLNILGV